MTNLEVVYALKQEVKPHIGVMAQSTFSVTMRNIELGLSKPITVKSFFEKFGYEGSWDKWEKKDGK